MKKSIRIKETRQIIAALRYWQAKGQYSEGIHSILDEHGHLSGKEIDALVEKIDCLSCESCGGSGFVGSMDDATDQSQPCGLCGGSDEEERE